MPHSRSASRCRTHRACCDDAVLAERATYIALSDARQLEPSTRDRLAAAPSCARVSEIFSRTVTQSVSSDARLLEALAGDRLDQIRCERGPSRGACADRHAAGHGVRAHRDVPAACPRGDAATPVCCGSTACPRKRAAACGHRETAACPGRRIPDGGRLVARKCRPQSVEHSRGTFRQFLSN